MILLAGLHKDECVIPIMRALERMRQPYWLIDQEKLDGAVLELEDAEQFSFRWHEQGQSFSSLDIRGAYLRFADQRNLLLRPEDNVPQALESHVRELEHILRAWAEIAPGRILNRPSAKASNRSKPFQTLLINQVGFHIPSTLITTDVDAMRAFHAQHGRIICKSISSVRSIVFEWTEAEDYRLASVKNHPTQFQAYIPGQHYRVHVVGDDLFTTAINSRFVDYRYGGDMRLQAAKLPPDIAEKCLKLSRALNLPLAGIDLKRTPDGEWYCFEVNTSPGYIFVEKACNYDIAGAIASYLSN